MMVSSRRKIGGLTAAIGAFCAGPDNRLHYGTDEPAWAAPLVGFARGDDPLFEQYKEAIGPFHWTPWEALVGTFPSATASPAEVAVIAWILPQTAAARADNRAETVYPAERWARSRIYGEQFNVRLRRHVVDALQAQGYPAVAPVLAPHWAAVDSDRYVYASTWSERHVAYACGLGTFGLCDGLITQVGKAVRIGSVVAQIEVPPTLRPYQDHHAYCPFFADGGCGECIDRCPAGAITEAGHDKVMCNAHLEATRSYVWLRYGFEGYGCGLCQTGVRCESEIPAHGQRKASPAQGESAHRLNVAARDAGQP